MAELIEIGENHLRNTLVRRRENSNKGDFGRLLCVCGSEEYRGAASLCVGAALACGVGIVRLASRECVVSSVAAKHDECVYSVLREDENGNIFESFAEKSKEHIKKSRAVLVGCGMGAGDDTAKIVSYIISQAECPVVIDADGLNSIKDDPGILPLAHSIPIVTPHIGEAARLTGLSIDDIKSDRVGVALDFARKYRCVITLKDNVTVVASPDGRAACGAFGNSGLAKGGSGDVLAGTIAALCALGYGAFEAACCGVKIHGEAARLCAKERSKTSMLPSDLRKYYGVIFSRYE